ncbi:MAG: sialidase family protein, partial [Kiritimatiellia bacterium]
NGNFADGESRGTRSHLKAYLSDDDGATWAGDLLLDERVGVSYPDGDQAADGTIAITYDFDRTGARDILMAEFREEDVLAGDAAAATVRRRKRINTARSYRVIPDDMPNRGIMFVDHQQHGRSGHGGNCLTECANGDIVAFYSNVSGELNHGHGTYGWSEYRRSIDGGQTWGEPVVLDYSRKVYEGDEIGSALVFALTTAPDGTLVAFVSHFSKEGLWVKQAPPAVLLSHDHGHTWSEPRPLDPNASVEDVSLTFDAVFVRDGKIYIVYMPGSANYCPGPYALYVSADNGATFARRSELPFDDENYYVTAGVLDSGEIIVYSYPYHKGTDIEINEHDIPYVTSADDGHTWSDVQTTRFARRIRNMQMSEKIGDWYYLHGRAGSQGKPDERGHLVIYASRDGINWDRGTILYRKEARGGDCYSANAVIGRHRPGDTARLLIQSSIAYEQSRVNECHWWIVPIAH